MSSLKRVKESNDQMENYFSNQINAQISKELQTDPENFELKKEDNSENSNLIKVKEESGNVWPKNLDEHDSKKPSHKKITKKNIIKKIPKIKQVFKNLVSDLEDLKKFFEEESSNLNSCNSKENDYSLNFDSRESDQKLKHVNAKRVCDYISSVSDKFNNNFNDLLSN